MQVVVEQEQEEMDQQIQLQVHQLLTQVEAVVELKV
jgi:hypothetical protein